MSPTKLNKRKSDGVSDNELKALLLKFKKDFRVAVFFSLIIVLVSIAPSLYMLEVYDRVVTSRSEFTLLMLTIAVIVAYLFLEILEVVRRYLLQMVAQGIDEALIDRVYWAVKSGMLNRIPGVGLHLLNDLKELRNFLHSSSFFALVELPLTSIYLIIIFYINHYLGVLCLLGVAVQFSLLWINHTYVNPSLDLAQQAHASAQNYASKNIKNALVIESMGMWRGIQNIWLKKHHAFLSKQAKASDIGGWVSAISKFTQQIQSSAMLGVGCWIALNSGDPYLGGVVILVSILAGKVLQPMVQLVSYWGVISKAKFSFQRLSLLLSTIEAPEEKISLPDPKGVIQVEAITVVAPGSSFPILKNVSFEAEPGKILCILGPSGSGKSTLAKVLVGVWPSISGRVRLDGADLFKWDKIELGPHIGYLSQEIEILDGTIAENVSRFGHIDRQAVVDAIRSVGLDSFVESLPDQYDTHLTDNASFMSGGQRQRLGLAIAIYKNPKLIVLDEPNSSLDNIGDELLLKVLLQMRSLGSTVIVISHRQNLINIADSLLIIVSGVLRAFGPKLEVINSLDAARRKKLSGSTEVGSLK